MGMKFRKMREGIHEVNGSLKGNVSEMLHEKYYMVR